MLITGKGFVYPTVTFAPTPGQQALIAGAAGGEWNVDRWSETQVLARIPGYPLPGAIAGTLTIRSQTAKTPVILPFTVTMRNVLYIARAHLVNVSFPVQDGRNMLIDLHTVVDEGTPNRNGYAFHGSELFTGRRADDIIAMQAPLKNGWRWHHVFWSPRDPPSGSAGSRLEATWTDGLGRLCARMHWWVDAPWQWTTCNLYFYIEGPENVPYK